MLTMAYHQAAAMHDETMRKGPWLEEEDERLATFVALMGEKRWDSIARASGLRRSGKSCRLRWMNYLRPDLKHGQISLEEEHIILQLHERWGNKWSKIARRLPGRTDNEIKNYWRTHLRKKSSQAQEVQEPAATTEKVQQRSETDVDEIEMMNTSDNIILAQAESEYLSSSQTTSSDYHEYGSAGKEYLSSQTDQHYYNSDHVFGLSSDLLGFAILSPYETRLHSDDWNISGSSNINSTTSANSANNIFDSLAWVSGDIGDHDGRLWDIYSSTNSLWD